MTPVHICITRDDVDAALLAPLIESNPNAAAVRDSFGWLPLHVLCTRGDIKGDRLAKIIEVLAPANPAAVSETLPVELTPGGKKNFTVLHMACASRTNTQCIIPLLKACPESAALIDNHMQTALHYLCKNTYIGQGIVLATSKTNNIEKQQQPKTESSLRSSLQRAPCTKVYKQQSV